MMSLGINVREEDDDKTMIRDGARTLVFVMKTDDDSR